MSNAPLAEQLRPKTLDEFCGLDALDPHLVQQVRSGRGRIPSLIVWGPPGSGKTTLAKLVGASYDCNFVELSAVLSGVKDVREVVEHAKEGAKPTLLFVDEIHRFNKGQQDAFLPHVESGVISLIGATTENPSFYLTGALLSRCRTVVLPGLDAAALEGVLSRGVQASGVQLAPAARARLISVSGGDGRRLLNMLEALIDSARSQSKDLQILDEEFVKGFLSRMKIAVYDRDGEEHYNVASAFIKSLRGSDADAALYYGFRMLHGGEDPRFLIRRLVIFASEDIGNADPRALQIAVSTLEAFELVGLPEGRIPIAQCITYLATAPKSNRSYIAMHRAVSAVADYPDAPVPLHLRNAETALMKGLGYGKGYRYPHDEESGFAHGVRYLPDQVKVPPMYEPSERGAEKTIKERLAWLRQQSKADAQGE
jgi:putative ATPase